MPDTLSPRLNFSATLPGASPAAAGGNYTATVQPKRRDALQIMVPGSPKPMSWDAFKGSSQSAKRGYVVFPTLDTRREISSFGRVEQIRKARWLVDNDELAGRLFLKYPRLIGHLTPAPCTPDEAWNAKAKRVWDDLTGSPAAFDRSGKFSFASYQLFLGKAEVRDGDALTVYSYDPETGAPQVMAYEGHLIGDEYGGAMHWGPTAPYPRWNDGVLVDQWNKALAYRLLDPDTLTYRATAPGESLGHDVPASSAWLFADWSRAGQARGVTRFHRIINSMLDVREIDGDLITGIKTSNLIGFFLGSSDSEDVFPGGQGLARQTYRTGGDEDEGGVDANDDDVVDDDDAVSAEDVFDAGLIPKYPGWTPQVLADGRPHQNYLAYLTQWKMRRMALAFDLDYEAVVELGNLNGNTARLLKEDVQQHAELARRERLVPFCQRTWLHFMSWAVENDALGLGHPREGHFLQVGWIPPRKVSIDRGAEGRLNLEEMRVGARTFDRHFMEQSLDPAAERQRWLDERQEWLADAQARGFSPRQMELVESMLFALPAGVAAPPVSPEPQPASADDEE